MTLPRLERFRPAANGAATVELLKVLLRMTAERHGVAVTAYSPFGHHDFPEPGSAQGKVLAEIAAAHGATPRQIALAFLTHRASVFAIPKAGSAAHVADNAGALSLTLTDDDIGRIDAAFPRGRKPSSLPMI